MNYKHTAFEFQLKNTTNVCNSVIKTCKDLASSGIFKSVITYNGNDMILNNNMYHINPKMFVVLLNMLIEEGFTYSRAVKFFSRRTIIKLSWEPEDYLDYYHGMPYESDYGSRNAYIEPGHLTE